MDFIQSFLDKYPKYKWHNDLVATLRYLHSIKDDDGNCIFSIYTLSEKLIIRVPTLRNYFKILEKLNILEWHRYVGKKGPIEIQMKEIL